VIGVFYWGQVFGDGALLLAIDIFQQLPLVLRRSVESLQVFERLASTQDYVKTLPAFSKQRWLLVMARQQVAGYGRQGRQWQSAQDQVAMSWRGWVAITPKDIGLVSLAVGLAIADVLTAYGIKNVRLKWPNDVYIGEHKIAGVLIDRLAYNEQASELVVGVGLNRLSTSVPKNATSLADHVAENPSLSAIMAQLLVSWHQWQSALATPEGCWVVRRDWCKLALWLGKSVQIEQPNQCVEGVFVGITTTGLLRCQTAKGEQNFSAGDVRFRRSTND
jgi:BirA family biotin operon repressor/biotin-[acetyl-CoA-carboxylase] ligase